MSSRLGRSNTNERGSTRNRRARRAWLLSAKAPFGGDGEKVPCWECGRMVDNDTMIVDRIVAGEFGGRYTRDNIRPHCSTCSCRQGARRTWAIRLATNPYDKLDCCFTCGRHFALGHADDCVVVADIPMAWR